MFEQSKPAWTRSHRVARDQDKRCARRARAAELLQERDELFTERVLALAEDRARINARLTEIGNELAACFEAPDGHTLAALP